MSVASPLRVDVWSDVVCPWCYVGKRRLEKAVEEFGGKDAIELVWRAFELDPSAPRTYDPSTSYAGRLAAKYGVTVDRARAMIDRTSQMALSEGLRFQVDRIQSGNTFDAHRVLSLALDHGLQDAMKERLFRAYFTEGQAIGDRATLVRLATEVGLDRTLTEDMLATDAHADAVRTDEALARQLGITGVPFFVVGERYAVSGAQPAQTLLEVLVRARDEAAHARDGKEPGEDGTDAKVDADGDTAAACDVATGDCS